MKAKAFIAIMIAAALLYGCGGAPAVSESESEPPSVSESAPESSSKSEAPSSSEPESEPEPAPEPVSASVAETPVAVEKKQYYIDNSQYLQMYVLDTQKLTYTRLSGNSLMDKTEEYSTMLAFIDFINALPEREPAETQPGAKLETAIMMKGDNSQKTIFNIMSDNTMEVDGRYYPLTQEQHDKLIAMAQKSKAYSGQPMWFVYMNADRVTSIRCTNDKGEMQEMKKDNLSTAATELIYIDVSSVKTYKPGSKSLDSSPFKAVYTFDNGVTYTVYVSDDTERVNGVALYVECSDMSYACEYKVDGYVSSYIESTKRMITGPANPRTGKPVIYLYPQKTTDVSVILDFDGTLATTIPAYNGGWNVAAAPGGAITNKADGKTYPYLFWDGWANRTDWDFSSGFSVRGKDVRPFLSEKLARLGLNESESREFIDYWAPEMSRNAWNLVAFSFEQYEETAPLTITPRPDTILRVHMIYRAAEGPAQIPGQVLPAAPARTGFTVVEWGGTRA